MFVRILVVVVIVTVGLLVVALLAFAVYGFGSPDFEDYNGDPTFFLVAAAMWMGSSLLGWVALRQLTRFLGDCRKLDRAP